MKNITGNKGEGIQTVTSSGSGDSLIKNIDKDNLTLKSLVEGVGIAIDNNPNDLTIRNTGVISLSGAGGNVNLVKTPQGSIKGLTQGQSITLVDGPNDVRIENTGVWVVQTIGTGTSLVNNGTNVANIKSLVAGSNISITDNTTSLTISSSGGAGSVIGPGSSTNNALVRWNGTSGTSVLDSNITLDNNGVFNRTSGNITIQTSGGLGGNVNITPSITNGPGIINLASLTLNQLVDRVCLYNSNGNGINSTDIVKITYPIGILTTTDATPTVIFSFNPTVNGGSNGLGLMRYTIFGHNTVFNKARYMIRRSLFSWSAGTVTMQINTDEALDNYGGTTATSDFSASGANLQVTVTGVASTTFKWKGTIEVFWSGGTNVP